MRMEGQRERDRQAKRVARKRKALAGGNKPVTQKKAGREAESLDQKVMLVKQMKRMKLVNQVKQVSGNKKSVAVFQRGTSGEHTRQASSQVVGSIKLTRDRRWKLRKGKRGKGKGYGSRHFMRGKPLKPEREVKKARVAGVYGCGKRMAQVRCRSYGVSGRAVIGGMRNVVARMERRVKRKMLMGPDRKRKETEAIQKEYVRGTVRGMKRKRGLPVRGQRTSTNGKTARRLNRKRG